ncbi:MAG: NHL repeat-containing protein, partial [Candidatus Hodarchaeales archaeon]
VSGPTGICFDSQWKLYAVDQNNDRVVKLDSQGNYVTHWTDGEFKTIHRIACDSQDNVYITDQDAGKIHKYDSNGNYITRWDISLPPGGAWYSVAVDSQDNVYVAAEHVLKYTAEGGYVKEWTTPLTQYGDFTGPHGIAVDSFDNIYIAECDANRVSKFDNNGGFKTSWGSSGSGPGQFNRPLGITVGLDGRVYVVEADGGRIQVFIPRIHDHDYLHYSWSFSDNLEDWNGDYHSTLRIECHFDVLIESSYHWELEISNGGNLWVASYDGSVVSGSASIGFQISASDLTSKGFSGGNFHLKRLVVYKQPENSPVLSIFDLGETNHYDASDFGIYDIKIRFTGNYDDWVENRGETKILIIEFEFEILEPSTYKAELKIRNQAGSQWHASNDMYFTTGYYWFHFEYTADYLFDYGYSGGLFYFKYLRVYDQNDNSVWGDEEFGSTDSYTLDDFRNAGTGQFSCNNVYHDPTYPLPNETISISADVTAGAGILVVTLHYRVNEGSWLDTPMAAVNDPTYRALIGPFNDGDHIAYYIEIKDNNQQTYTENNAGKYFSFDVSHENTSITTEEGQNPLPFSTAGFQTILLLFSMIAFFLTRDKRKQVK